jgi:hypothetical protein
MMHIVFASDLVLFVLLLAQSSDSELNLLRRNLLERIYGFKPFLRWVQSEGELRVQSLGIKTWAKDCLN